MAREYRHSRAEARKPATVPPRSSTVRLRFDWPCQTTTCSSSPGSRTRPGLLLVFVRRVQAQLTEFRDEGPCPAVNVVFPDRLPHALHTQFLFLRIHLKSETNGFRRLVDIVGVDLQCIPQLVGGAGETTQD